MNVRVFPDADALVQAGVELLRDALAGGVHSLVLAGGTTPRRIYRALEPGPEWGRLAVLFGDERCVAPDEPDSNYYQALQDLLVRVHPATVHRIPAELGPEAGATLYEPLVARYQPLDLVLLGIGQDGHTASLFPGAAEVEARGLVTAVRRAPKPPPERVSLTLGALRAARRVVLLATGADKAEGVARAARGEVPAGMIPGAEYLLDTAAGARL